MQTGTFFIALLQHQFNST